MMRSVGFLMFAGVSVLLPLHAGDPALERLLSTMSVEEKAGQLNLVTGSMDVTGTKVSGDIDRLILEGKCGGVFNVFTPSATRRLQELAMRSPRKIPLIFGYDVIHGHRTIFPIPLCLSYSWNTDLIRRTAHAAAAEAAADGLHWTFSPMVDIGLDARWGRVAEGAGEDPWLGSRIAEAMVRGYQGTDLSAPDAVAACVKHLALYGAVQAGRDYNSVDMSRRAMEETYFPPYRAALDAGARTVMTAFNEINGVPASGNRWLLTDVLRNEWGFGGMVVTDYTTIEEMVPHGFAADGRQAARQALYAGVDMDMVSGLFLKHLPALVESGEITLSELDQAVYRVLELKRDLGLFRDPFSRCDEARAKQVILSDEHRQLARQAARESIVLLKNHGSLLPLKRNQKIAWMGPLADSRRDMIGCWSAAGNDAVAASLLDGVRGLLGGAADILHAKGADLDTSDYVGLGGSFTPRVDPRGAEKLLGEADEVAAQADVIVLVLGEGWEMTGEAASRADIRLPASQRRLARRMLVSGKPCVLVVMSGRPLDLSVEDVCFPSIVATGALGTEGGHALAEVLFGDAAPVGKLTMGFPHAVGQLPMTYRAKNTGRPIQPRNRYTSKCLDVPNEPLYPFGYGLTYGSFEYGSVSLSADRMKAGETITASAEIINRSDVAATETMQLYIRDLVGSVTRPVKELRGYQRVTLKPGERRMVTFEISDNLLSFPGPDFQPVVEPGEFEVMIGPDSGNLQKAKFTRL